MKKSPAEIRNQVTPDPQYERSAIARGFLPALARNWRISTSGVAAAEFALVLPVLVLIFFGIIKLGVIFHNYIELMNGAENGARQASIERAAAAPLTTTIAAAQAGASGLTSSGVTVAMYVNGVKCGSDAACNTVLTQQSEVTVQVTYPCNMSMPYISLPKCTLTSTSSEIVQ